MNIESSSKLLVYSTYICAAMLTACSFWSSWRPFPPINVFFVGGLAALCVFMLTIANGLVAMIRKGQRASHLAASLLGILVLIATFSVLPNTMADPRRKWFLTEGVKRYTPLVSIISDNVELLTSRNRPLKQLLGEDQVYGKTNQDGSITIEFHNPPGLVRHGYMFYNGQSLERSATKENFYFFPENPGRYFLHITNEWYQF